LIEESRVNIHENNHSGLRGSGTSNGDRFHWDTNSTDEIAPDGSNSTFKVYGDGTETNPGGSMYVFGTGNDTVYTTTNIHTSSVFIKPALNKRFRFDAHSQYASDTDGGSAANISFYFDLSTTQGEVTSIETPGGISASVTPYPNGWYRCTWTYYRNSTNVVDTNYGVIIYPEDYYNAAQGTGTYFYVWGPQVEEGAFPTSYIPTSGSAVTRNGESTGILGDNFSSFYNQSEGTFQVQTSSSYGPQSGYPRLLFVCDSANNQKNCIQYYYSNGSTSFGYAIWQGGSSRWVASQSISDGQSNNVVISYDSDGNANVTDDGVKLNYNNPVSPYIHPTALNRVWIGCIAGSIVPQAHFSQISYYPTRLSNAQLQTLTN
jgi:hypothetical protein